MLEELQRSPPPALADNDALFLDVDGTLVAFADHPDKVIPADDLPHLLALLSLRLKGALALVSGRSISQLDALFSPVRLPAAGLHGAQLRHTANADPPVSATAHWLHALHRQAENLAQRHPGMLVENKGQALALHWRNAPDAASAVIAFARAQLPHLPGVRVQPGNHVIEFIAADHDKGKALLALMEAPPFAGRRPVFIGDDLTDEHGFGIAAQLGGHGVLVGARTHSLARYALADVAAVHAWLHNAARST
ncbi:trehalose-phosphatase [Stenotrophomonas sp. SY1]|jgi:trehalose 6-phosphate phosphatase|uniref:trehalose-phosphatase n=1 Tax=Stenotrophomonas sp. SY1 TaxID=477235 RepID=UPI001E556AE1|nr:trehalose-phosphatase [Stenotrophomonas sp. SY1]MCD9086174.1 trehalose-phosphatase [Stenotrophomonas sp. SY1]